MDSGNLGVEVERGRFQRFTEVRQAFLRLIRAHRFLPPPIPDLCDCIALGNTRMDGIVQRSGLEQGPVCEYLSVLQDLRALERETPATERDPKKAAKEFAAWPTTFPGSGSALSFRKRSG